MNMKSFVILFLVFVWLSPAMAQLEFDPKEKERMAKARVKTQTEWTHDFVDGKPSAKGYKSSVTRFDTRGNIIEITNFNDKGEIISIVVYQYDNRDNRVNYERHQGNRQKLQYSQKTSYDANGNKIRETGFDGATMYNNTFKYDNNEKMSEINYTVENALVEKRALKHSGNKTEISVFDASNNLTFKQENTYNSNGMLLSEVKTGGTGNTVHTLNLQYNNTDLTEEVKTRADNKLDYQKTYQYDSESRPIKEETTNTDGTKFVSNEYQYNSQGDLVFKSWRKNERAKEASTNKITYDAKGLKTEMESYFASYQLRSLYKYTYEFY